jgi:hypothetical protein
VNVHEERFWKQLVELGALEIKLGGKHALDLRAIRITNEKSLRLFCQAFDAVVGRSNANQRHVDRSGCPIFVVTDYYTIDQSNDRERHEPERLALIKRSKHMKETL